MAVLLFFQVAQPDSNRVGQVNRHLSTFNYSWDTAACSEKVSTGFAFCPACGDKIPTAKEPSDGSFDSQNTVSISRNGQIFGPYPIDVVRKWVELGQLNRYDLGYHKQNEGWIPLGRILWPQDFAKAGTFSRKQMAWIVAAVVGFLILIGIASALDSNRGSTVPSTTKPSPWQNPQNVKPLTDFEKGNQYFESGSYSAAKDVLGKIPKSDPTYADAQAKLQVISKKIQEQEQKEKRKDALRKQYEKLCRSGLYVHEIEQRLQRENFHMDDSRFEKAPDGSTGVRRYFSKTTSDGFVIKIWLQNAYALGYHYWDVQVE